MICAGCGLVRDPDDLIAFWPVGDPGHRRFACRVTRPSPVTMESCFRAVVRSRYVHQIGPATPAAGGWVGHASVVVGDRGPEPLEVPA